MPLVQLESILDQSVGEDLSTFLEDEEISISLLKGPSKTWVFQAIVDSSQAATLQQQIVNFLQERLPEVPSLTARPLPEKDWVQAVYQGFSPLTLGRFYVYGSHTQELPPRGLFPLKIDAATAFGSGHHESTEGCLQALSLLSEKETFRHPLDMGCGSGILALAMARLWGVSVIACDNDPEAVRVTTYNADLNGLASLINAQVSQGFSALQDQRFDLITANILAGPLRHMAKDAVSSLKPGGVIILAGLLDGQAEAVIRSYIEEGMALVQHLSIRGWSTLIMKKGSDD